MAQGMIHLQRGLAGLAVVGTLGFGAWVGTAAASAGPFDQTDFPCQEDEVLGFDPAFGPDRVGCIHIEDRRFDVYAFEVGDDDADGVIREDESGWDCATMGNRVCGSEGGDKW